MRAVCVALCAMACLLGVACGSEAGVGGGEPGGLGPADVIGSEPGQAATADASAGPAAEAPSDPGAQGMAIVPAAVKGKSSRFSMESTVAPLGSAEAATLGDGVRELLPGIVGATAPDTAKPPLSEQ